MKTQMKTRMKRLVGVCLSVLPIFVSAQTVQIDLSKEHQVIRGFGGINFPTWIGDLTESQRATAFGNGENQLGLSVLRIHVDPSEGEWERDVATAQYALKQGAYVFASPWSPPSSMCESYSTSKRLKTSSYADYVKHLNKYIDFMKKNNVELYAMSIQNEPDYGGDWTWWPSNDMATFMADYAQDINCRVMAPESFQYTKSTSDPILNNSKALANLDILATHLYGTQVSAFNYPLFQQKGAGKELWMTEVYYPNSSSDANTWPEALEVADHMTNALVVGNFQAYVWWYIRRFYSLINDDGDITKRGYCFAQYSKFVRPGFIRVDATQNPTSNVNVSAFKKDDDVVIVLVNKNTSSKTLTISIPNTQVTSWMQYVTTGKKNVAKEGEIKGGTSFQITLEAQSATTLVGTGKKGTPKVSFVAPTSTDDFEAPASVTLTVDASDEDGNISSVTFYQGENKLTELSGTPFTTTVDGLNAGKYTFTAVAKDNEGNEGKASITITINMPKTPYNGTPSIIPGKIEIEEYDYGGNGRAYYDTDDENKGNAEFRTDEAVDIESCDQGRGKAIGYTAKGEWLEYTIEAMVDDEYDWVARVASGSNNSSFRLSIDGEDVTSSIAIPKGEDWTTYSTIEGKTKLIKEGKHTLRVTIDGDYANLDWISFGSELVGVEDLKSCSQLILSGTYSIFDIAGKKLGEISVSENDDVEEKLKGIGYPVGVYLLSKNTESIKISVK